MELLAWGNTAMEPHLFPSNPAAAAANPIRMRAKNFCTFYVVILNLAGRQGALPLETGDSLISRVRLRIRW